MRRSEVQAVVERCCAGFVRLDSAAVAAEHSDDCTMESPTAGGVVTGRAAVASVLQLWFDGFPDLTVACEELLIDGDRFAQLMTLSGTDKGGFLGLPATGRKFRVPLIWMGEVRNGQVTHTRAIYDFSGVLIQVGLLKAKPA